LVRGRRLCREEILHEHRGGNEGEGQGEIWGELGSKFSGKELSRVAIGRKRGLRKNEKL